MPVPPLGHTLPLLLLCMLTIPVAGADAWERRGVAEVTPVVAARDVPAPPPRAAAPDFTLQSLDGPSSSLHQYQR